MSLNNETINKICRAYQLGKSIAEILSVSGGLLHQAWQLKTTRGVYIIKQLNPDIMEKNSSLQRYRTAEEISQLLQNVTPSVPALYCYDDVLFIDDNDVFMVFPYIHGKIIKQDDITSEHVSTIAAVLSFIHNSKFELANVAATEIEIPSTEHWKNLLYKLQQRKLSVGRKLDAILPDIINITQQFHNYLPLLQENLIISHRDLDPKNVLWDKNQNCHIIDWESAGYINQVKDLVVTAIYWCIDSRFIINELYLAKFIKVYSKTSSINFNNDNIKAGIAGLFADWLNWLAYNIDRILSSDPQSYTTMLGLNEAQKTIHAIPILNAQIYSILQSVTQPR